MTELERAVRESVARRREELMELACELARRPAHWPGSSNACIG